MGFVKDEVKAIELDGVAIDMGADTIILYRGRNHVLKVVLDSSGAQRTQDHDLRVFSVGDKVGITVSAPNVSSVDSEDRSVSWYIQAGGAKSGICKLELSVGGRDFCFDGLVVSANFFDECQYARYRGKDQYGDTYDPPYNEFDTNVEPLIAWDGVSFNVELRDDSPLRWKDVFIKDAEKSGQGSKFGYFYRGVGNVDGKGLTYGARQVKIYTEEGYTSLVPFYYFAQDLGFSVSSFLLDGIDHGKLDLLLRYNTWYEVEIDYLESYEFFAGIKPVKVESPDSAPYYFELSDALSEEERSGLSMDSREGVSYLRIRPKNQGAPYYGKVDVSFRYNGWSKIALPVEVVNSEVESKSRLE